MRPGDAAQLHSAAAHRPQQLFCKRSLKAAATAFRQQLQQPQWWRLYAAEARTLSEFPKCRQAATRFLQEEALPQKFFSSVCLGTS